MQTSGTEIYKENVLFAYLDFENQIELPNKITNTTCISS